jgi:hypothetical protein
MKKSVALCLGTLSLLWVVNPASAQDLIALTNQNRLVIFDSQMPITAPPIRSMTVTGLQAGESLLGIDVRPLTGQVFGLGSTSRLYTLNLATGQATQVGSGQFGTLLNGTRFGFDFNPTVDRIRVVSDADQNLRLNPDTGGIAAVDGTLAFAGGDANAGQNPNVVASAYTNNFVGTSTTLFGIDSNLDVLVTQIPPNNGTLNTVGALGVDTSDLVGFDIAGPRMAVATLTTGGTPRLYQINLDTGAAALVGSVGGLGLGEQVVGVTFQNVIPEPSSLLLGAVGFAGLLGYTWRRRRAA